MSTLGFPKIWYISINNVVCPQAWHQSCERTIIYQEMVTLNKYYWVDSDMTSIIPIGSMITLDIVVGPQVWHQSYEHKILIHLL